MSPKDVHPIDTYVGQRLRYARVLKGLSQEAVANALQVTFQQIQKYEKGRNRMSVGRLWDAAKLFEVPMTFFFQGYEETGMPGMAEDSASFGIEPTLDRDTLALVRAYHNISNPALKNQLLQMAKTMAASGVMAEAE